MSAVITETVPKQTITTAQTYQWLIKRELWEHRALYIAPLILAAIVLLGFLLGLANLPDDFAAWWQNVAPTDAKYDRIRLSAYVAIAVPFPFIMSIVTAYYALDALYAERRDRSVLFWKSLPISDIETVISKLAVAVIIAPMIGLAVAVITQTLVFGVASIAMALMGNGFINFWRNIPVLDVTLLLLYGVTVQTLWYLPLWAWCLLASSWAPRSPFLVAAAPLGAIFVLEPLVLRTNNAWHLFGQRLNGVFPLQLSTRGIKANTGMTMDLQASELTNIINPSAFISSPQLWLGLVVAGIFIAATIWMRRYRESH